VRARTTDGIGPACHTMHMASSIEEMAYDLSRSGLDQQERSLADLRARAANLIAAASIAGALLTRQGDGSLGTFVTAALFFVSAFCAVWVLLPHSLVLNFRGSVALSVSTNADAALPDLQRAATVWLERFYERNARMLHDLRRWYFASCVALIGEIVSLFMHAAGTF